MAEHPVPLDALNPAGYEGYGLDPLPSPRDRRVRAVLEALTGEATSGIPKGAERVLGAFAERAASLAVRRRDTETLRLGGVAAALALSVAGDFRDELPALALLCRAAELIGVDPRAVLPADEPVVTDFLRRAPRDRAIGAMGFRETVEDDGFRFVRTW